MTYKVHEEKDRFSSRLATIPGVRTMPSVGDWILLEVESPSDLARKVNRRLAPGTALGKAFDQGEERSTPPISVPRNMEGQVRVHVRDPKVNEVLLNTLRDVVA
jgi:histidinol-phosphate/aromatic aminotransferase/cobyric acid decarboxylase-like protein